MNIFISNASDKPIYLQIIDQLKKQILSGALKPDDPLPSIRLLAKELRISVITTKRAYDELEHEGFVYSVAGKGTYTARVALKKMQQKNREELKRLVKPVVQAAKTTGITLDDLIGIITHCYEEEIK